MIGFRANIKTISKLQTRLSFPIVISSSSTLAKYSEILQSERFPAAALVAVESYRSSLKQLNSSVRYNIWIIINMVQMASLMRDRLRILYQNRVMSSIIQNINITSEPRGKTSSKFYISFMSQVPRKYSAGGTYSCAKGNGQNLPGT